MPYYLLVGRIIWGMGKMANKFKTEKVFLHENDIIKNVDGVVLGCLCDLIERGRLLVLATKHCPHDHHDWKELVEIAKRTKGR